LIRFFESNHFGAAMSDDGDNSGAESEAYTVTENRAEMEGRHKTEKRELEIKGRFMIKQANKNKKKAAEAEAAVQQVPISAFLSITGLF
jgi:hypothetical protein